MNFLQTFWSQHKYLVKFCLVAGIFIILALRLDWAAVEKLASNIQGGFFTAALIFMIAQVLLLSLRWQLFMNAENHLVDYKDSVNMTVASQLANFLFITSVGGIVLRIFLARHFGLPLLNAVCAVVADRFMTLVAILFFAVLLLPVLTGLLPADAISHTYVLLGIFIPICVLTPFILTRIVFPYIRKHKSLHSSAVYLKKLFEKPDLSVPIIISSLLAQGVFFMSGYMSARALGLEVDLLPFLSVLPLVTLVSSLPLGFGGWGIREGAFIVALKFLGIPMETAFLISVQVGILSILATFITALPLVVSGDFRNLIRLSGKIRKTAPAEHAE